MSDDEDEIAVEVDDASLLLMDGYCVILNRDIFMSELGMPMMVRMTGSQIWVYWYKNGEWTYSEIKAKERGKAALRSAK